MKQYVLVKLDDTQKTGSTGGVVTKVTKYYDHPSGTSINERYVFVEEEQKLKNYKLFIVDNENVKVGWIYQDKTHIFLDSNISNNI